MKTKHTTLLFLVSLLGSPCRSLRNLENFEEQSNIVAVKETLMLLLNAGRSQEALKIIQDMSKSEQAQPEIRMAYGRSLVQLGKMAEGEQILIECVNDIHTSLEALLLLSRAYIQTQRWSDAELRASAAVSLDPKSSHALAMLAKIYIVRDEDPFRARLCLERAVSLDPTDDKVRILLHIWSHNIFSKISSETPSSTQ